MKYTVHNYHDINIASCHSGPKKDCIDTRCKGSAYGQLQTQPSEAWCSRRGGMWCSMETASQKSKHLTCSCAILRRLHRGAWILSVGTSGHACVYMSMYKSLDCDSGKPTCDMHCDIVERPAHVTCPGWRTLLYLTLIVLALKVVVLAATGALP